MKFSATDIHMETTVSIIAQWTQVKSLKLAHNNAEWAFNDIHCGYRPFVLAVDVAACCKKQVSPHIPVWSRSPPQSSFGWCAGEGQLHGQQGGAVPCGRGSLCAHTDASGSLPASCWPHSPNYEHHLHADRYRFSDTQNADRRIFQWNFTYRTDYDTSLVAHSVECMSQECHLDKVRGADKDLYKLLRNCQFSKRGSRLNVATGITKNISFQYVTSVVRLHLFLQYC